MNALGLLLIIPLVFMAGMLAAACWFFYKIKKELGFKSGKEFIDQAKRAQEIVKKMEKMSNPGELMNDPKVMEQIEKFQRKFEDVNKRKKK